MSILDQFIVVFLTVLSALMILSPLAYRIWKSGYISGLTDRDKKD